ncbi:peptidoglycan DD-metalloendopeptidase family protein [Lysobacter auxotrophicus]|uniref:Peptidoglycan DD-metalloendopeptidase family protein n=1 Tax=Lysobacter auxotrophicus TaxID=2992573 RepID=A0ABN6UGN9_9GAMM|nr:M23 family metallopeptidase [Lysobacter auxotrophicus]BDU15315.1 peptidoglycan DD-metalloendopeptidase family protein [Lysobacter auxotrophicus]
MRRSAILVLSLCVCACTPATVKVWPSNGTPVASNGGDIVVQLGDSLFALARRHGVSAIDLAQANGIAEPYLIHPGDRLRLPSIASSGAVRAPSAPVAQAVRTEPLPEAPIAKPPVAKPAVATTKPVASRPAAAAATTAKPAATKATTAKATASTTTTTKLDGDAKSAWHWPAQGTLVNVPARNDAFAYALDIAGTAGSAVRAASAGRVLYSGEGSAGYEQLVVIEHPGGWVSSYSHNRKRLVREGQVVAGGTQIAEMGRVGANRDMLHFELRRAGQLIDPRTVLPPR